MIKKRPFKKQLHVFDDGEVAYSELHPSLEVEVHGISLNTGKRLEPTKQDAVGEDTDRMKKNIQDFHFQGGRLQRGKRQNSTKT